MNNISILKAIRTKLLNKKCNSEKEFELIQDKLNEIELHIKIEKAGIKKS